MTQYKQQVGNFGQKLARRYLLEKGYVVLAEHYCIRGGEIDLIAQEKQEIAFIEVKTRTSLQFGRPEEAVQYYKKQALLRSAQRFLIEKKLDGKMAFRFDIIAIRINKPEQRVFIKHMRDVMIG